MFPDLAGQYELERRLQNYLDQISQYHDLEKQELARALIPLEELQEKAAISLAKEGKFEPTDDELNHFVLLQLLYWFKATFRWMNSPACNFCASKTHHIGMGVPNSEELLFGAGRVELYSCELCGTCTRFPRYNDPVKLMETQCGRCGEWANCFTFFCIALGYKSRLVIDFTDHVWTECYTPYIGRWMHLDPCEGIYDKPLLYEKGWGKKLNYVIGFAKDGVYDVTRRYTRKWSEVLSRRTILSESLLEEVIAVMTAVQRSLLEVEEFELLELHDTQELKEILDAQTNTTQAEDNENLPGRLSGSEEWRVARGEIGTNLSSYLKSGKTFCPPRKCIDEHVGSIFEAIGRIYAENHGDTGEKLKTFNKILLKFKNQPYKTRMLNLDPKDDVGSYNGDKSAEMLFSAIGLRLVLTEDDMVNLCMKDSPEKVALALQVATENLDNITRKPTNDMQLMVEYKRVCGGVVYSTGEQMPSGIASSAFDGLVSTKWEEPDGAEGSWLVYHLHQDVPRMIIGYELTSANDCPERDPMDWVLEGSDTGGKVWNVLHSIIGHTFNERFERRSFRVTNPIPCNILRLRFSATRDCKNNSRLQLSCIDFYY